MANPLIALVGRPNVGKSTFFNKVAGRKIAITENRPGVTRDRLYADAEWRGKKFTVVDTGGIELKSEDTMWREIFKQADVAIDTADVILFFTDGREGLSASDYDVADVIRPIKCSNFTRWGSANRLPFLRNIPPASATCSIRRWNIFPKAKRKRISR